MWRDLERRLARAEISAAAISWADREAAHQRQSLRAWVKLHKLVRERFRIMGLDPALAVTLRHGEEAAAALAAIPDTPELIAADEAIVRSDHGDENDGARRVRAAITRIAERYRSGEDRLDLANASPAELLAFCVAVEMEAWGDDDVSELAGRDQSGPRERS